MDQKFMLKLTEVLEKIFSRYKKYFEIFLAVLDPKFYRYFSQK
jgi:hypothetical protein